MKKIAIVAIALFVCAILLGVGGVFIAGTGSTASIGTVGEHSGGSASFCDPMVDPGCPPPCTPYPGCLPGGP
ncbi:MAG: hypothetical protein KKF46_07240 [Nanoarchaeota archaeon]|nr:hypothetical protein [Nanoarchaeota archaeon]MBU1322122.1 hypothetical protein [Nanoarchaeota archaeon]MBU2442278.1 hypothetical protein [Nanoarchaeota archaeon]